MMIVPLLLSNIGKKRNFAFANQVLKVKEYEQYKDTDRSHRLGRSRATGSCPYLLFRG